MGTSSYIYTIPGIPASLNLYAGREAQHWKYRKAKEAQTAEMKYLAVNNHPPEPFAKAYIDVCLYFRDNRRRDLDNYLPKGILDGLVLGGVLKDDSWQCIAQLAITGAIDRENPRTEIIVTGVYE